MKLLICDFLGITKGKLKSYGFMIKPTLILTAIYTVAYLAIFRANFNYADDMGRVAEGYSGWGYTMSRFLSDFLSTFVHADFYLMDVSPLPQLLAVVFMAISSTIVLYVISGKTSFSFWEYVAVTPLALTPYFLQCISYKYDSPYMALSVLFSVLPLLVLNKRKTYVFCFITLLCNMAVCVTYQAALGIFPMLLLTVCLQRWIENKTAFKQTLQIVFLSAIGYVGGVLFFKLFIMVPTDTYVSNTLPNLGQIVPTVVKNLYFYYYLIFVDFNPLWTLCIICIIILFILKQTICSEKNKAASFTLAALVVVLMMLLVFGLYPALSKPLFDPRAMYGAGAFLSFISVSSVLSTGKGKNIRLFVNPITFMLAWMFFSFSFAYGNALYVQKEYTDFRIIEAVSDIKEFYSDNNIRKIQIEGSIGYSKIINNFPQNYNMMKRLIPVTFCGKDFWGGKGIAQYYGLNLDLVWGYTDENLLDMDLPLLKDTMYHTVYGDDSNILVKLK